jgi:hypothetical protein
MSEHETSPCLLTIGTYNRRAGVTVLVESFLKHHPSARVFVCLVDRPNSSEKPLSIPGTVFYADELTLPGNRRFLFKYQAFELCCALKPYAMAHVMECFTLSHLVYLDSDIFVTAPFWDELQKRWADHAILLTPHWLKLPVGVSTELQRSFVQHGMYNGGFVAVKQDPDTRRFLDCWAKLLESQCTFDPMNNVYVDQRWLDLLAASSSAVGVLRDAGLNVGYWNLHERQLEQGLNSTWLANYQPLKFFHFSGFDRDCLTHKMACSDENAIRIGHDYGRLLDESGEQSSSQIPYGWDFYCDGSPIPLAHRDLILSDHAHLKHVADPFALPTVINDWATVQSLANTVTPVRIGQRYREGERAADILQRLHRHPLLGLTWKLWYRFVNPSLRPDFPWYDRA